MLDDRDAIRRMMWDGEEDEWTSRFLDRMVDTVLGLWPNIMWDRREQLAAIAALERFLEWLKARPDPPD